MPDAFPFADAAYVGLLLIFVALLYTASILKVLWEFKHHTTAVMRQWVINFPVTSDSMRTVLVTFILIYVAPAMIQFIALDVGWLSEEQVLPATLPLQMLLQVALIMFIIYKVQDSGHPFKETFGLQPDSAFRYFIIGLAAYVIVIPWVYNASLVNNFILDWLGQPNHLQEAFTALEDPYYSQTTHALLIIQAGFFAPVCEEFVFRGILMVFLIRSSTLTRGIVASSAIFAIMHFNQASLLPLFVLSLGFSIVYIYSKSIIAPITMHAAFNLVSIISFLKINHPGA
jgi:membrane protease YdiL (CAAX protease family)